MLERVHIRVERVAFFVGLVWQVQAANSGHVFGIRDSGLGVAGSHGGSEVTFGFCVG